MVNVVRILNIASSYLRANLLHNASMASGELFHSNMLAFLLEQTRPEIDGEQHVVLASFMQFAGCPDNWPTSKSDLGNARATVAALQAADLGLNPQVLAQMDDEFVAGLTQMDSESTHDFVQREVLDFDALVTLHHSAHTEVTCRARRGHGNAPRHERTLEDMVFRVQATHFRLAVEVKVKSVATDGQIRDQWRRLHAISGDGDGRHHLLLTLYPFETAAAHPDLTVRTFHEYVLWLRRVHPVAKQHGENWIPHYLTYLKILRLVARCTLRLVHRAHDSAAPYHVLDQDFQCLRRCRLYASYQKMRASFMAAHLERMLRAADHPIGTHVRAGDRWPLPAAFHVYSHYSNGAGGFGAAYRHAPANVVEFVGIQVQGQDYRSHVSWEWIAAANNMVSRITTADVEMDGSHLVEQRRNALNVLAAIAGPGASLRNYDYRWRGYGRPYGNQSPQQLLQTVFEDVRALHEALQ